MLPPEKQGEPDWLRVQRQRKQEAAIGAKGGIPALIAFAATVVLAVANSVQVQTSIYLLGTLLAFLIWRKSKYGSALAIFGRDLFLLCALATFAGFGAILSSR